MGAVHGSVNAQLMLSQAAQEEAKAAMSVNVRRVNTMEDLRVGDENDAMGGLNQVGMHGWGGRWPGVAGAGVLGWAANAARPRSMRCTPLPQQSLKVPCPPPYVGEAPPLTTARLLLLDTILHHQANHGLVEGWERHLLPPAHASVHGAAALTPPSFRTPLLPSQLGLHSPGGPNPLRAESPDVTLSKPHDAGATPLTPDVRLWHRAVGGLAAAAMHTVAAVHARPARTHWLADSCSSDGRLTDSTGCIRWPHPTCCWAPVFPPLARARILTQRGTRAHAHLHTHSRKQCYA